MSAILYKDKVYGAGGSGGGGASAISDLTDVDLDNLSDGQILKWNDSTQKWENADESGGGGNTLDVLYNNSATSNPSTITLQKPLTDYDFIITHIKSSVSGRATIGYIYTVNSMAVGDIIGGELAAGNGWIWYTYTNATTLTYLGVAQNYYLKSVYGVKIGSGGGGGSAYSETDVWAGSADMYTSQSLTLDDDYTSYDALRFEYNAVRGDAQSVPLHYEKVVSAQTLGTSERFIISDFYLWNNVGVCVSGTFTTSKALTTYLEAKNWFRSCTLTRIVGIKY